MYLINSLIEHEKIGIVIYGSLYHYPGILENYLKKEPVLRGPKLKVSLLGLNQFKGNLTRVIDYENGEYIETAIRIFNEGYGIEQIKRYITLREGNINYIILYSNKNKEIINIPEHLIENKKEIIKELNKISDENKIDYLFFTAYPPKIKNIKEYINEDYKKIRTREYLLKCDKKTYSSIEKKLFDLF